VAYVLSLCLGAVVLALILTAAAAPVVGAVVLGPPAVSMLFVGAALLAAATIGYEVTGSLLLGIGRRRAYVIADLLRSVATLGLTVAVLSSVRTASAYVLATGLAVVVPTLGALLVVRHVVGRLRPRFDAAFSREALRLGLAGQVGNVLTFVNLRLDLLLVPALLRLDLAGIYFVATRVSEVVGQVSTASAAMLFPHVAANGKARETSTTERATRLTLLVTFVLAVVLAVAAPMVLGSIFGPAYRVGFAALLILLLGMLPMALTRTLVADLVLIPRLGIEGAAVASALAYAVTALVLLGCYRRVTGGRSLALLPCASDLRDLVGVVRRTLPHRGRVRWVRSRREGSRP
jgi:O-antigen/teichoic acid export membrane protein